MPRLKPPSTQRLLTLLPLLASIGLGGVILILTDLGDAYSEREYHLLQVDLPKLRQVEEQLLIIDRTASRLHQMVSDPQRAKSATYQDATSSLQAESMRHMVVLDGLMNDFLENFEDEEYQEPIIEIYDALHAALQAHADLVATLLRAQTFASAAAVRQSETISGHYLEVSRYANELRKAMLNAAEAEFTESSEKFSAQLNQAVYYSLIVLLLASLLTILATRQIRLSMTKVRDVLENLASSPDAPLPISLPNGSEYQAITEVAKRLARSQQALHSANLQLEFERGRLEHRVEETTKDLTRINATLRQQIEERALVQKRLELYRTMVNAAAEPIVITDQENRILEVNQAYLRECGYSRAELIGRIPIFAQDLEPNRAVHDEMWRAIEQASEWSGEIFDRCKKGVLRHKYLSISRVLDETGNTWHHIAVLRDISGQKEQERKLAKLAFNDPLTNLPNRALFYDRLEHEFARSRRTGESFALLYIDLDGFKPVNDQHGHEAGDEVLKQVGERLRKCIRDSDTAARVGGDEFTVILSSQTSETDQMRIAGKIIEALERPFQLQPGIPSVCIGASIGIAQYPEDGDDSETLVRHADQAMYRAKQVGKGSCMRYAATIPANRDSHAT